jgi:hypothetical protein
MVVGDEDGSAQSMFLKISDAIWPSNAYTASGEANSAQERRDEARRCVTQQTVCGIHRFCVSGDWAAHAQRGLALPLRHLSSTGHRVRQFTIR